MNKKLILMGLLLVTFLLSAQNPDIHLGAMNFPRAYIHAGTEYPEGFYEVVLTFKDAVPFFNVYNSKQELLFEEQAIVKTNPRPGKKFPYRLKKEILKGGEYFRIKVIQPDQWLMGYFLVKD
ncbi:MAG: hypothetical protein JXI33_06080 [Candidatus Aminicenantes bacterium]|nr:hypothetical protein [Candidatus Aminicenantes bacterium]